MGNYKVKFLRLALEDLEEIILYIAKDSTNAALRMHDEIIKQSKKLETFPDLGRKVPDEKISKSGFRMLMISSYIAFYRVIGDNVYIYRVLHGTRDYPKLYDDFKTRNLE